MFHLFAIVVIYLSVWLSEILIITFAFFQIWGCENSGLFHAFSRHILHRLDIPERSIGDGRIHVTFLVRDTKFRRILNQPALIKALENNKEFIVRKVKF